MSFRILAIVFVGLLIASGGPAAAGTVDYLDSILWSGADQVVSVGNHAYCSFPNGILVLDVTDPALPLFAGQLFLGEGDRDLAVSVGYLHVASGDDGLKIFSLTDPAMPQLIGTYSTLRPATAVSLAGDHALVTTGWVEEETGDNYSEVLIIDVATPASPQLVGQFNVYYQLPVSGIDVSGTMAFATYGGSRLIEGYDIHFGGLALFDIIDISAPEMISDHFTYDPGYNSVSVSGDHAFVAHQTNGLEVFNVAYSSPFLIASHPTPGQPRDIRVAGNYAYLADGSGGIQVIDVSTPGSPAFTGSYDPDYYINRLSLRDNHAFVAGSSIGIEIVDLAPASSPTLEGSYHTPYTTNGVFAQMDHAYLAQDSSGLQLVDIQNPLDLALAGNFQQEGIRAQETFVQADQAYLADFHSGLTIIDVTDPQNPDLTGGYDTPDQALGVSVVGNLAFLADGSSLQIIDITDPESPGFAGSLSIQGYSRDVVVSDHYAYVAGDAFGLRVVDITDPGSPVLVGTYNTPHSARGVFVSGAHAYVADGYYGGLQIVDISDPQNPVMAGEYPISGATAHDVVVENGLAYLAAGDLYVIDTSVPANPVLVGFFATPGQARGVAVADNVIYLADGTSLLALQYDPAGVSQTVEAQLSCVPGSGTLPFNTLITATMTNLFSGQSRRLAARLDATLASGTQLSNWRTGSTIVAAGSSFVTGWSQNFPALGALVGDNLFNLVVEDITPAPFNQPPYPPAGSSAADNCTVTGFAP